MYWSMIYKQLLNSEVVEEAGTPWASEKTDGEDNADGYIWFSTASVFIIHFLLLPTGFLQIARNTSHHSLQVLCFTSYHKRETVFVIFLMSSSII